MTLADRIARLDERGQRLLNAGLIALVVLLVFLLPIGLTALEHSRRSENQALRDELAAYGAHWDDLAWAHEQLYFVGSHQYWTDAARQVRGEQKRRNVELIEEMIERCRLHS